MVLKKTFLFLGVCWLTLQAAAQYCPVDNIAVYRWSPAKGSIARYAAAVTDTCSARGIMLVLGCDSVGIYTIEAGLEDDARGGDYARLVVTGYDGQRTTHNLYNGNQLEKYLETDSLKIKQKEKLLGKLWQLSSKNILPRKLEPLKYKTSREDGLVKIKIPKREQWFSWQLTATSTMCWCIYDWHFVNGKPAQESTAE